MNRIEIRLSTNPQENALRVNGVDLTQAASGIRLAYDPNTDGVPRLEVGFAAELLAYDGPGTADVAWPAREALIALGWTPPYATPIQADV